MLFWSEIKKYVPSFFLKKKEFPDVALKVWWKFVANFQSNFHLGLQVCLKVSLKLSRLHCKFTANFQGWIASLMQTFKAGLQVLMQSFRDGLKLSICLSFVFCFFFDVFLVVKYVCCWHMHGFTGFNLARSHVFFLGTWIGSNELMISSACVTDFFWHKSMATMSKGHKRNETRLLARMKNIGNETLSKHAFCLGKLSEGILSKYHCFLVFLVKDFGSQSLTISAQSLLNPFGFFDVMPHTCPARHELNSPATTHPWWGLAWPPCKTMHPALLPLNGCGYCLERHHLLSELFKACWLP